MKKGRLPRGRAIAALFLLALLSAAPSLAADPTRSTDSGPGQAYPASSWALGIVAPEGAHLAGGGGLRWGSVTNVTALLTLPNITRPDAIVYAVVSVMASDGTVLQAAAGIYPGSDSWLAYSQWISGVGSSKLTYYWLVNGSGPVIPPGSRVTISIFRSGSGWSMGVRDDETGSSIARPFPQSIPSTLASGDQEAFALESYSKSSATFGGMGNMTLDSLLADGQAVTGGLYGYGDWDMIHNPVFAVGSSGTSPPGFVSLQIGAGGECVWSYSAAWKGGGGTSAGILTVVAVLLAVLFVLLGVVLLTRKPRPGSS